MRFEKLNENKIRITLSHQDLVEKDIDFHSFMSNSIESQDLFFDMLKEAEKEIGFVTKDYRIHIEALAMADGDFILTVTRALPETSKNITRKKVHIKRRTINSQETQIVYSFSTFEDYCSFIEFFKNNSFSTKNLAKSIKLYEYNNVYYLVLSDINIAYPNLKKLLHSFTEFANYINHSEIFVRKLLESGKLIMKHNAICICMKHFTL